VTAVAGVPLRLRTQLSLLIAAIGGLILVGGPARMTGQWTDRCRGRFGWTHAELMVAGILGLAAFVLGY
jgi:hypothetical protein